MKCLICLKIIHQKVKKQKVIHINIIEGTIHISTTKGRSLIATKDYVVGDIVLEEDAYAFIFDSSKIVFLQ
jgi:hypothetical protein